MRACLVWLGCMLGLLAGCEVSPVDPPSAQEAKLLSAVVSTRDRLSWRQPAAASDPVRQDQVLGWFIAQLTPQAPPVPAAWTADRAAIQAALLGQDLAFPLAAARTVAPDLSRDQVIAAWLNANLLQNDAHSRYLPAPEAGTLDKVLRIYDQGLGLSVIQDEAAAGGVRVSAISVDSPAAGEKHLSVDSQLLAWRLPGGPWVRSRQASQWQEALSGEVGTRLGLRWRNSKSAQVFETTLQRSWWSLAARRATGELVRKGGLTLGIIRIPLFYNQTDLVNTSADLREQRDHLRQRGAQVLVLDMRGNPGGFWQEAIASAGAFAPSALVAEALPGNGAVLPLAAPATPDPWTGPLWVWIDRDTASAAEVLAGFLRENSSACLVGERTSGKGSIQILSPLSLSFASSDIGGQVVITSMLYRWHSGATPQYWGLAPDVWTRDPAQSLVSGERRYPNAVRWGKRPVEPKLSWSGHDQDWLATSLATHACARP